MQIFLPFIPRPDMPLEDFLRPLSGRPFCDWVVKGALAANPNAQVTGITTDEALAETISKSGATALCLTDHSDHLEADLDLFIAQEREMDDVLLIDPAFPLITPELITAFIECAESQKGTELFSWIALPEDNAEFSVLQYLPQFSKLVSSDDSAIFALDFSDLLSPVTGIDWPVLEHAVRLHGYIPPATKTIKLLVLDADGVLNDAGFYYGPEGEVMKKYNTRDGAGIKQLQALGVEVGIITGEKSGFTPSRAEKLGITRIEVGCSNKLPVLDNWRQELKLEWEEVAYMGDDLPDLPCIKAAGIGACPSNAEPELLAEANFVAAQPGGHGCVRDLIRYMIQTKQVKGTGEN